MRIAALKAAAALRGRPLRYVAVTALGIVAALFVLKLRNTANDDFFITYRYAANLAAGRGLVFNHGERVFGITEPGQGLLLAALTTLTRVPLPWLATLTTATVVLGLVGLLGIRRRRGSGPEAVIAAVLLVTSSYLWVNNGCGGLTATASLLAAATLADRYPRLAGGLAGLAVWFRPDALVGVGLLTVLRLDNRRSRGRFVAGAAWVVGLGLLAAWIYYGSPIPNTLGAKGTSAEAAAGAGSGLRFWLRGLQALRNHWGDTWWLIVLAGAGGSALALRHGEVALRLLTLHGWALAIAYPLLGVPFYSWYAVPTILALLVGVSWSMAWLCRRALRATPLRAARWAAAAGAIVLLVAIVAGPIRRALHFLDRPTWPPPHMATYREAGLWLRANSPAEARIAYVEIGILGYYSERYIYDLLGLVSPNAIPFVARHDIVGAFRSAPTDYVVFHTRGGMQDILDTRWFRRRYRAVAHFSDPSPGTGELVIYARHTAKK